MDYQAVDEIKRHFNVFAEGLRSDFRMVIEGLSANTERLDKVEVRLVRVEGRLERVEHRLDAVESELGGVKAMIRPLITRSDA